MHIWLVKRAGIAGQRGVYRVKSGGFTEVAKMKIQFTTTELRESPSPVLARSNVNQRKIAKGLKNPVACASSWTESSPRLLQNGKEKERRQNHEIRHWT